MPKTRTPRKFRERLNAVLRFAGRPDIFFYLLIWLMILLVSGTIAEKNIGLYLSQQLYFSSFVIWIGNIIPVPGGYSTLTLIFVSLLSKLIIERWTKQKIGTLVVHCGALLLLLGGFLTATFSSEGNMVINEGANSNYVSDYHRHELAITNTAQPDAIETAIFPQNQIKPDRVFTSPSLPFRIKIDQYYDNSSVQQRATPLTDGSVHGMLVANDMQPMPLAAEEEENRPGLIFRIIGVGKDIDGRYAIFEDMPIEQHLIVGDKRFLIVLRHKRTYLPFRVKLIKFDKQMYPGTDKARSYSSEVVLTDGDLQWHSLISMNNPLRYKGYTFYQASFAETEKGQATVLAVVKNIGAVFPYISSITICLGLLVHMFVRIPKLKAKGMSS